MTKSCLLFLFLGWAGAQLSGIVNQYAAVEAFTDPTTIQVDNAAGFAAGDRVLVYQAKGATIDQTNSATYGDITAINGAGLFEFGVVQSISGDMITLSCPLTRSFDFTNPVGAAIQLVKVSYHAGDVSLTGTVTTLPWDGQKGGLVVIETEGTLTFNADIDVRGRGFRGGDRSLNGGSGSACNTSTYFGASDDQAGRKGEGIANWPNLNHYGYRGKIANGGGGGNNHNCGGGGGGNYGAGGKGGWTTCGSRWWCPGVSVTNSGTGLGGLSLSSYLSAVNPRLFFGGGGGGGHQNNDQGGAGGPGGGIVILRASQIVGNGRQILASGAQGVQNLGSGCGQGNVSFAGNDGGGGGGGGGAIALYCPTYAGNLTLDVRGAAGQNCGSPLCACTPDHGPGGGGGSGYAWFSTAILPPGLTVLATGGQNGIELTPLDENQHGCTNTGNCIPAGPDRYNRGATPGQNGASLYSLTWTPVSPCPLSTATLRAWTIQLSPTGQVRHEWEVATEKPLSSVEVTWKALGRDSCSGQALLAGHALGSGQHTFPAPGVYEMSFFVRWPEGGRRLLAQRTVRWETPFHLEGRRLFLSSVREGYCKVYDTQGRLLLQSPLHPDQTLEWDLSTWPAGFYLLETQEGAYRFGLAD